ncbi:MAG: MFS transporter, partial [Acidimicrobiales bacterium]
MKRRGAAAIVAGAGALGLVAALGPLPFWAGFGGGAAALAALGLVASLVRQRPAAAWAWLLLAGGAAASCAGAAAADPLSEPYAPA